MGVEQVVRVCFVSLQGVLCCLFVSNGEKCQQRSGKRTRSPFLDPKNQRTVSIVQMRVRTLEYNETDEIRNHQSLPSLFGIRNPTIHNSREYLKISLPCCRYEILYAGENKKLQ